MMHTVTFNLTILLRQKQNIVSIRLNALPNFREPILISAPAVTKYSAFLANSKLMSRDCSRALKGTFDSLHKEFCLPVMNSSKKKKHVQQWPTYDETQARRITHEKTPVSKRQNVQ